MEKSAFFNSVGGDRRYKAEEFAEYFNSFIGNGVFPQPSTGLQVIANNNMIVTVRAGKAWINGYFYSNNNDLALTLGIADGVLNRIDRVVVRWDMQERSITVRVKQGAYSANPVPPALERTVEGFELALADIYVGRGVVSVIQANITDQRFNTSLCGIVVGVVQQIDPSVITAQFDSFFELYRQLVTQRFAVYSGNISELEQNANAQYLAFLASLAQMQITYGEDFEAWLEGLKDLLDEDALGTLLLKITDLQERMQNVEAVVENIPVFAMEAWLGNSYSGAAFLSSI